MADDEALKNHLAALRHIHGVAKGVLAIGRVQQRGFRTLELVISSQNELNQVLLTAVRELTQAGALPLPAVEALQAQLISATTKIQAANVALDAQLLQMEQDLSEGEPDTGGRADGEGGPEIERGVEWARRCTLVVSGYAKPTGWSVGPRCGTVPHGLGGL